MKRFRPKKITQPSARTFSVWIQPNPKKYLMACCDCGLVHEMQFRVAKSAKREVSQFRARRHVGKTAQMRGKQ